MPLTTKNCTRCERPFETRHALNKYCSGRCYVAAEAARGRDRAAKFTPERRRAYALIQTAIARGDLIRRPCETCGSGYSIHAHHDDYAQPLAIRWLCNRCHRQHHRKFGPGLNAYRAEEIA